MEPTLEHESGLLARDIRAALEEAGGMFVKLGQVLSTRADLLPSDVIAELFMLQDHVAPADPASIEALLTAELGAPPHRVFASFDPAPLAAASIGQGRCRLSRRGMPRIGRAHRGRDGGDPRCEPSRDGLGALRHPGCLRFAS
jgi:hypothetical protein